jgi:hypothetical protein
VSEEIEATNRCLGMSVAVKLLIKTYSSAIGGRANLNGLGASHPKNN